MAKDTLISFDNLERVLTEYGKEITAQYRHNLLEMRYTKGKNPVLTNRIASGELFSTVQSQLEVNGQMYNVVLSLADYWKYIENGRPPGKFPPTSKILDWITIKPVIPRPDDYGRIPTPKQLAYLIGRKIANEGYEGSHELQNANDTILKRFEAEIVAALSKDLGDYLQKIVIEIGL